MRDRLFRGPFQLAFSAIVSILCAGCGIQLRSLRQALDSSSGIPALSLITAQGTSLTPRFRISGLADGDAFFLYRGSDSSCEGGELIGQGSVSSGSGEAIVTSENHGVALVDPAVAYLASDFRALIRHADGSTACTNFAAFRIDALVATQIASAGYGTCALLPTGSVSCWGLANGSTPIPTSVAGITDAVRIAVGYSHACALHSTGSVSCWGSDIYGELGDGTPSSGSATPVPVSGISDAVRISAGKSFSCALLSTGSISCWGFDYYGQVGNGSTTTAVTAPDTVSGITDAVEIASGQDHSCAILSTGAVSCWGKASSGQLGNGSTTNSNVPVPVTGITDAVQIASGTSHSCALLSSDEISCWGLNSSGQLGNGSTTTKFTTPVSVSGIANAVHIALGDSHTCAALSTGAVACWGMNTSGQLGDGSVTLKSTTPVSTSGISNAAKVSAGRFHSCAVLSSGAVSCWGSNTTASDLGNGLKPTSPTPVSVSGITNATQVASTGGHGCAVLSSGSVSCWGKNDFGQLGNGSTTDSSTPVAVSGITDAVRVALGDSHTCALLATGSISCWGLNSSGQLGDGSTTNSPTPVAVSGITDATEVASGANHGCARHATGLISCWGLNSSGQLGNGSTTNSSTSVPVFGITDAVQVSSAGTDGCALLATGTISCWGSNASGQLGNGSTTASNVPVPVSGIADATQISAGGAAVCARLATGSVSCWGSNTYGQLGNGSTTASNVPVPVTGITDATQISAGGIDNCAVLSGGSVSCWGQNNYGQLGDGSTTLSKIPLPVSGIENVARILSAGSATCAVFSSGGISCWGTNAGGVLGVAFPSFGLVPDLR